LRPRARTLPAPNPCLDPMERRDFLALTVKTGGALVTGVVLAPAVVTTLSPLWETRREGAWVPVGALEQFAPGSVSQALVEIPRDDWAQALRKRGVFVWRPTAEEVVVYSRS